MAKVMIIGVGSLGDHVALLQRNLLRAGYEVEVTHLFDEQTESAVKALQRRAGLVVDGIAGPKTLAALAGNADPRHLSDADLARAAELLGVPLAAVRAVNEVESRGAGMLPDGRPVILFERHVFWQRLQEHGTDPAVITAPENILSKAPGGYHGGTAEYMRLASAKQIHVDAALESASWGAFQIMGYHWQALGYDSIGHFVECMQRSEADQLDAFVRFIQQDAALLGALKARKWARFAELYNGHAYKRNLYDAKLAQAFARHSAADKAAA